MRTTKIVSGLVALVMASGILLAADVAAKAKPEHDLVVTGKEIDDTDKFKVYGSVSTYAGKRIKIQRKVNNGRYKLWKKTRTSAETGEFSEPIFGGRRGGKVCYKVVVPATNEYRTTKKRAGCITTAG